jgi:hypothetical protein
LQVSVAIDMRFTRVYNFNTESLDFLMGLIGNKKGFKNFEFGVTKIINKLFTFNKLQAKKHTSRGRHDISRCTENSRERWPSAMMLRRVLCQILR